MAQLLETTYGHRSARRALMTALNTQRLAATHIFSGPPSVGRRRVALGLAQKFLCTTGGGCGVCAACRKVEAEQHEAILGLVPDGQQIKIDQVKEILAFLRLQSWGPARFVLIEDAAQLTQQAGNALLKTLEEPPPHTYLILLTSQLHAVMSTLRSRAAILRFEPLPPDLVKKLVPAAEDWMVRAAQGEPARARQFLDADCQELRAGAAQVLRHILAATPAPAREQMELMTKNAAFVLQLWRQLLRDVLVPAGTPAIHADLWPREPKAVNVDRSRLHRFFQTLIKMESDLARHVDKNLIFENLIFQTGSGRL